MPGRPRAAELPRTPAALEAAVAEPGAPKKKVLFLMSDTGGGHRASAQALVNAMDKLYPGQIDADVVDIWTDYATWPYRKFVPWYAMMAKRTYLWRMLWYYGRFWPTRKAQEIATRVQCSGRFREAIRERDPDLVVSVHPLCQDIPLRQLAVLDGGERRTPFVTVVTDLGSAHNTWFDWRTDYTFVPSTRLEAMALRCGLDESKVLKRGLPLREGFWSPESRPKPEVRRALDMADLPTALVVGGGDGVGGIAKVARAVGEELGHSSQESAMVVVCGKNADAKAELDAHPWPANVKVTALGFVNNMDEWMAASDCIVTKAGPGTIAEAATRGLPTLLSSHLPGQEAGNVDFVVESGFGAFTRKPAEIAATVAKWLEDATTMEQMRAAALEAARPNATLDIARDIGGLLFEGKLP